MAGYLMFKVVRKYMRTDGPSWGQLASETVHQGIKDEDVAWRLAFDQKRVNHGVYGVEPMSAQEEKRYLDTIAQMKREWAGAKIGDYDIEQLAEAAYRDWDS